VLFVVLLLSLSFLVLVSTSTYLFNYFVCHEFSEAGESYLRRDYSIDCNSDEYLRFIYFVLLMIFIYPVGAFTST